METDCVCVWPFIFFCRLCSFMLLCVYASICVRVCPSVCVCGCVLYNTKASSCTFSLSLAILALCFPLALAQWNIHSPSRSSTLCPPYLWSRLSSGVRQVCCVFCRASAPHGIKIYARFISLLLLSGQQRSPPPPSSSSAHHHSMISTLCFHRLVPLLFFPDWICHVCGFVTVNEQISFNMQVQYN